MKVEVFPAADVPRLKKELRRTCRNTLEGSIVNQLEVVTFYGATVLVAYEGAEVVSVHASRAGTSRRNAWGRYLNWYTAYTRPDARRRGYARALLAAQVERTQVERIKSLVGTWDGLQLHLGCGHQVWGPSAKGELQVDTPARPELSFPDGIPHAARGGTDPRLYTVAESIAYYLTWAEQQLTARERAATTPDARSRLFTRGLAR